ncbi:DeoR/GlpR family DNA-binding transcription regulator [Amphibacillus cookii]|uniref:DeoR/GlpR family DNA-binding transcription regulator n=1 Tax=Amphibacillus cookii TaxID=767787 RepID=UPI00195A2539|nr:DeoR/GlpR family DNA-binding transcription regulator [Amphibacillus cookii]MBM7541637.1 DeoR/GlpR family transcriptional regulator of sugar metabolism [Amphibacillus cookii]
MKSSTKEINNRRDQIVDLLLKSENNYQSITDLSRKLNVSSMTIRRDLISIEKTGLVNRVHGGAKLVQNQVSNNKILLSSRLSIAKKAAQYISNNQTIYINSSNTAIESLNHLDSINNIVVTNNLNVVNYINNPNLTILIPGGELRSPKRAVVGDMTIYGIQNIHADISILGCSGISASKGITTNNIHEAKVNELMIRNAEKKVIIVADSSKVGINTNFPVCDLSHIDVLITDSKIDLREKNEIRKLGVEVIAVEN